MADFRERFNVKMAALLKAKNFNGVSMSEDEYTQKVNDLKRILQDGAATSVDYRKKKRFEVMVVSGAEKLVKSQTNLLFVHNGELFDVIQAAHLATGHGGRNATVAELAKNYANVTREAVLCFLSCCDYCQKKKNKISPNRLAKHGTSSCANCPSKVGVDDDDAKASVQRSSSVCEIYGFHFGPVTYFFFWSFH